MDDAEDTIAQKRLLELHRKIIALEKLDIRREKALITAEEMKEACRKLFADSKECIVIIQDRKVVCVSPALAELLGYSHGEMIDTSFAVYVHTQELLRLAGYYLDRMSGGGAPSIYRTILKRRDRLDVRVEITAGIFPFYGKPADLVIIRELNE